MFRWEHESSSDLNMAFSKKQADDRKLWMQGYKEGSSTHSLTHLLTYLLTIIPPGDFMDYAGSHVTYSEFVHKELIQYSLSSVQRAIPSIIDGLKPSQRKVSE